MWLQRPGGYHQSGRKGQVLLPWVGGCEPSRRPRASCSSHSHCHFSLKPFHSPSPGQGSVNTHQLTSLSATQCWAGQRVVHTPGWPAPFPHILRKPRPQGTLYCSLAGHTVLSFKSLIPVWLYIKLCQLHKGRGQLVRLHISVAQCPTCKCLCSSL